MDYLDIKAAIESKQTLLTMQAYVFVLQMYQIYLANDVSAVSCSSFYQFILSSEMAGKEQWKEWWQTSQHPSTDLGVIWSTDGNTRTRFRFTSCQLLTIVNTATGNKLPVKCCILWQNWGFVSSTMLLSLNTFQIKLWGLFWCFIQIIDFWYPTSTFEQLSQLIMFASTG